MKFEQILNEVDLDDPLNYVDYGKIIPNLKVGDKIMLHGKEVGIVTSFPRRNIADVKIKDKIKEVHLSAIEKRL